MAINPQDILIALCDGHGDNGVTAGKRTPIFPNGEKDPHTGRNMMYENSFNKDVMARLDKELKRHGFRTLLVAPTDADTPLSTRVNLANSKKANLYISIHANANTGKWGTWGGIETFCYPSGDSKRLATIMHKYLIQGSPLTDRKVKDGSHLYVIKYTKMPAVLAELGFMDSTKDYKYLLSDAYRQECAVEMAKGICEYYGVQYKAESKPETTTVTNAKGTTFQLVSAVIEKGKGTSAQVKEIQKALIFVGESLPKFGADGDYGDETVLAVKSFQKKNGLVADGIYGPNTYKKLLVAISAKNVAIAKAEAERIAKEKAEAERKAREKAEAERIAKEKAEAEAKAKAEAEAKAKAEAEEKARKEAEELAKSKEIYRVRKDKDDVKSQIGAFGNLESAKDLADKNEGYCVYDCNGVMVYEPLKEKCCCCECDCDCHKGEK